MLLDDYQDNAGETAIYPRVYTEAQVVNILKRFAGRELTAWTLVHEPNRIVDYVDEVAPSYLDEAETPFNRLVYPVLGLVGEAGEIANKLKKVARDEDGQTSVAKQKELAEETGDVLWYVAAVTRELRIKLSDIADSNLAKLFSRQKRGVLGGSGDGR